MLIDEFRKLQLQIEHHDPYEIFNDQSVEDFVARHNKLLEQLHHHHPQNPFIQSIKSIYLIPIL